MHLLQDLLGRKIRDPDEKLAAERPERLRQVLEGVRCQRLYLFERGCFKAR